MARHRGFEPLAFGSVAAKITYFLGFFTTFYDYIMFDNLPIFKPKMGKNTPKMHEKYIPYICINYGEAMCPEQIKDRSICIDADIGSIIKR